MHNDNNDDKNKTGYGKPPKHGQFRPGRSGNPKGRPRGRKNLATVFFDEADEKIPIIVGGREMKISKYQASVKRLFQKALEGHPQSLVKVIEIGRALEPQKTESEIKKIISKSDQEILNDYLIRNKVTNPKGYEGSEDYGNNGDNQK